MIDRRDRSRRRKVQSPHQIASFGLDRSADGTWIPRETTYGALLSDGWRKFEERSSAPKRESPTTPAAETSTPEIVTGPLLQMWNAAADFINGEVHASSLRIEWIVSNESCRLPTRAKLFQCIFF